MTIFLPIAEISVDIFLLLGVSASVGILSGLFGIEAYIFDFAHGKPLAYGFIAVLIAFFAGIFADFVFRRI